MNIYRPLFRFTVSNFLCCIVVFYLLDMAGDKAARSLNTLLGWIFFSGLILLTAPLFLSKKTNARPFSEHYIFGTVCLSVANLVVAIVGSVVAYGLTDG